MLNSLSLAGDAPPQPDVWLRAADLLDPPADPYAKDPVGFAQDRLGFTAWSKQREIMLSLRDNARTAVRACHGPGKSLALDTPLPTPTGWTTMGDVAVGDRLLDEQGRPCTITYVSPIWTEPCSRVTFDDGTNIVASDDHRWSVTAFKPRNARRNRVGTAVGDWRDEWALSEVRTTAEIAESLTHNGQCNWAIPTTRPLDLPPADLLVDPYVLGVWLGDGSSAHASIYAHADDVPFFLDQLAAAGELAEAFVQRTATEIRFGRRTAHPATVRLRDLGVLNAKHIPSRYLRASAQQRLALLQGIMDTDGCACEGASASIDLCDERLLRDVAELVRSFGWKVAVREGPAVIAGRVVGTRWRLHFRPDLPVFRMPRKAARVVGLAAQRCRQTHRMIVAVDPVPTVPTQCVTVDSPSHLYLAGAAMVPTHNTAVAAQIILWFLAAHPGNSRVITTAPTWAQVADLLWRELRASVARAHAMGALLTWPAASATKLELGEQWFAIGHSTDRPERFQGHHADHLLLVVDEASGVDEAIFEAAEGFLTAAGARILLLGNPTRTGGTFHRAFTTERANWSTVHISAYDCPNETGESVPENVARALPRRGWAAERLAAWGEDSPIYQVRVAGNFPSKGVDTVIALGDVEDAQARSLEEDRTKASVISCDVARYGTDETIICERVGQRIRIVEGYFGKPTTHTAARVAYWASQHVVARIVVDDTGVGGGVTDQLRADGWQVTPFNAANAAFSPLEFPNRRSELWFQLAEQLPDLDLDADEQLCADLVTPKYTYDLKMRRVVESKDAMRSRIGRSPDRGDAVMLTLVPEQAHGAIALPAATKRQDADRLSAQDLRSMPM